MHNLKSIREHLGVTQQVLADGIGCTQANVSLYERGQTLPPSMGQRLITFSVARGVAITFEHVYGAAKLPAIAARAVLEGVGEAG